MPVSDHQRWAAIRHLRKADPVMPKLIDAVGPFTLRLEPRRVRMLVRSILSQQISTGAARSIRMRLEEAAGGVTAARLAELPVEDYRAAGVSPQKTRYILDLARKVLDGEMSFRKFHRMTDQQIIDDLTKVKGIGTWTAHMFLIFSLGRLDVLPTGDLGIRTAIRKYHGCEELPDTETVQEFAKPWRPYSTVASWYCWRSLDIENVT